MSALEVLKGVISIERAGEILEAALDKHVSVGSPRSCEIVSGVLSDFYNGALAYVRAGEQPKAPEPKP